MLLTTQLQKYDFDSEILDTCITWNRCLDNQFKLAAMQAVKKNENWKMQNVAEEKSTTTPEKLGGWADAFLINWQHLQYSLDRVSITGATLQSTQKYPIPETRVTFSDSGWNFHISGCLFTKLCGSNSF